MHDLDRVRLESDADTAAWAPPTPGASDLVPLAAEAFEFGDANASRADSAVLVFDEEQELELASDLLAVGSEADLDQFLGRLIGRAGQAVRSPTARAVGGYLKGAARQALPAIGGWVGDQAGTAIGGRVGGALDRRLGGTAGRDVGRAAGGAAGRRLGAQAGAAAGRLFGLELEGLSGEDQEFEVARHFVRFAGATVRNAATAPATSDPAAAARAAAIAAAERHAPGLLRPLAPAARDQEVSDQGRGTGALAPGRARSGRWMRRGNRVVVLGL